MQNRPTGSVHISLYNSVLFWQQLNVFQKSEIIIRAVKKGAKPEFEVKNCIIMTAAELSVMCFWRMI